MEPKPKIPHHWDLRIPFFILLFLLLLWLIEGPDNQAAPRMKPQAHISR